MVHGHEQSRTIHHRRVDHLTLAGHIGVPQGREDPHQQEHGSATEVADEVERRQRPLGRTDGTEHSRDGDVVDVMSGGGRQGALLAPTSHPSVHQPGIGSQTLGRSDSETLGHAWTESLDQCLRTAHEPEDLRRSGRVLQIHGHRTLSPSEDICGRRRSAAGFRSDDLDHFGAQVGQDHPGVGNGTYPTQLDDAYTVQRSWHRGDVSAHPLRCLS